MWWRKGANRCSWSCAGNCIITFTTQSVLPTKTAFQLYHSANNSTLCLFLISAPPSSLSSPVVYLKLRAWILPKRVLAECDELKFISISIPIFRKVIQQQLLTFSSSSSRHFCPSLYFLSVTCCRRQFLLKLWPICLAFLLFIYIGYSCPPERFVTLLFSHDRPKWASPSFSNTAIQNFL